MGEIVKFMFGSGFYPGTSSDPPGSALLLPPAVISQFDGSRFVCSKGGHMFVFMLNTFAENRLISVDVSERGVGVAVVIAASLFFLLDQIKADASYPSEHRVTLRGRA